MKNRHPVASVATFATVLSLYSFAPTICTAQRTVIHPADHATVEGSAVTNTGVFGSGVNRQQFIYDKAWLGLGSSPSVTKVGFRQNGGSALPAGRKIQVEVRMGASTISRFRPRSNFDNYVKNSRVTVVKKRILDLPAFAKPKQGPSPNNVMVPLDTPFRVDTTKNLIVEYLVSANNQLNKAFTYPVDFATFTSKRGTFGTDCKGSNGKPIAISGSAARVAGSWSIGIGQAPISSAVVFLFGLSKSKFGGAVPLPIDMTKAGAPGCKLQVDPLLMIARGTSTRGQTGLALPIPGRESLYRTTLYAQAIAVDPFANSLGLTFSKGVEVELGMTPRMTRIAVVNRTSGSGRVDAGGSAQYVTVFEVR